MLNIFPELLTYGLLAPFILRVVLGVILMNLGLLKIKTEKERWIILISSFLSKKLSSPILMILAVIEIIGGFLLIIGIYTQVLALMFSIILSMQMLIEAKEDSIIKRNLVFYMLLASISLSLLFSGAGAFAMDLAI